jgi:hypothetical protein
VTALELATYLPNRVSSPEGVTGQYDETGVRPESEGVKTTPHGRGSFVTRVTPGQP